MVRPKALWLFTKQRLIDTGAGKTAFHQGEEMNALFAGQGVVAEPQSRGMLGRMQCSKARSRVYGPSRVYTFNESVCVYPGWIVVSDQTF